MPAWASSIVNLEMGKFLVIAIGTFILLYRYFPQLLAYLPLRKAKLEEDAGNWNPSPVESKPGKATRQIGQ